MENILFIKANDRSIEESISVKMYHTFVEHYKKTHPQDRWTEIDLFNEELPYLNAKAINANYKLANQYQLSPEEREITDITNRHLDQFLAADKVMVAFPLWNFAAPAVLHTYLDYLCQAGKTFKYTPEGPVGLISDKKVVLLNARGGVYSEGPAANIEFSLRYVESIFRFFGIQDVTPVIIEGHNQFPDRSEVIIEEGLKEVAHIAETF